MNYYFLRGKASRHIYFVNRSRGISTKEDPCPHVAMSLTEGGSPFSLSLTASVPQEELRMPDQL